MKLEVKAVKQTSIYDKEQTYVVIGEGEGKVIINVGAKTFEGVSKLIDNGKPTAQKGGKMADEK